MFKKNICSSCKTGKESFLLDPLSLECPYIARCKNGKCTKYVKLENEKNSFWIRVRAFFIKAVKGDVSR